ncbi:MAG: SDR family oxidoreductase [Lachnospiraceae bacterium]|nr:SDR family oxidoreductase [Lachnospiraceae bacterium]
MTAGEGFRYYVQKIEELTPVKELFTLKGKVALITGAGGGIGRSTAYALASLGADVALMDISQKKELLEHNAKVIMEKNEGVKAICVYGDVADRASVQVFVDEVVERLGTIDVVHSNAGIGGGDPELGCDISEKTWNRTIGINLTGVLNVDSVCAQVMRKHKHGGSIINTASMSGHIINKGDHGARYMPDYAACKAAVIQLTKAQACDWVLDGIRVNSISPGIVLSGLHDGWPEEPLREAAKLIPMERFASLDEIGGVVAFLATDLSSYITGTDILIDGGYTIW